MPTPTTTVPDYCSGLTRSRLLPGDRVSLLYDAWRTRAGGNDADVDGFRKFLVAGRHLTEYQAVLLQRGHVEGFLLGAYVILDRTGKGLLAYKAVHPASGQIVSLKILPGARARNPNLLAVFQREGRLLTQLNHPNVARTFQVGHAGGVHFLVTEPLDGETLDVLLARRKQLPPGEAARLIVHALRGLQHLHEHAIVHRGLQPKCLMLMPPSHSTTLSSTLKILDTSLGRGIFDESAQSPDDSSPDYLAPEQARDARTADIRADIYALGGVLYHLIAGHPPYPEENALAAALRHATEPVPTLTGAPPELVSVIERMLAKKAADRFATPADAAEALEPFVPSDAAPAAAARVVPAYAQWLAAEGRGSVNGPVSTTRLPPPMRSGPMSSSRLHGSGPVSSTRLGGLAAARDSGPVTAPPTLKPPSVAPRPAPNLIPPPDSVPPEEADVELMPLEELPARVVYSRPERPLWDLDRRDFLMLGLGAGGVAAAVTIGIFIAKFNRDKMHRDLDDY